MPTFHLVNAFTLESDHSGNQAAVVQLDSADQLPDERKALIARDFNFAETAYLVKKYYDEEKGQGEWSLRWWTPDVEVILCGHATLASALVLFEQHPRLERISFVTRWSGTLYVKRITGATGTQVEMSLPSLPDSALAAINTGRHDDFTLCAEALKPIIAESEILRVYRFPWDGFPGVIVELDPKVDLKSLAVKADSLRPITTGFVLLTQVDPEESKGKLRIQSRVFAPNLGVDEDPVTGSAHAYLTSYYTSPTVFPLLPQSATLNKQPEELEVNARQLSARGGSLRCWVDGERVKIIGKGAIWGSGSLAL